MVAKTQMVKWGNSLAVRIPKTLAEEAEFKEGDLLVLEVEFGGSLAIRAAHPPPTLDELVARITPENRHEAMDWHGPVGNEIW